MQNYTLFVKCSKSAIKDNNLYFFITDFEHLTKLKNVNLY